MAGADGEVPPRREEPKFFQVGFEYLKSIEPKQVHRGDVAMCSFGNYSWYYGLFVNKRRKRADGYWMREKDGSPIGGANHRFLMRLDNSELRLELVDPSVVPDLIKFYDTEGLLAEEYKKSQMPMPHDNKIVAALKKINPF